MASNDTKNILLVGVGGQGTILASNILSTGLISLGYDVKMSEIHGMSQRGGNVSTQIRFGSKVNSPIVGKGEADVIVAFEKMEALRWVDYLRPNGSMIVNDFVIPPLPVLTGAEIYPRGIIEELEKKAAVTVIDAGGIAESLGNAKAMNVVLLGATIKALSEKMPDSFIKVDWAGIVSSTVKAQFVELNVKALSEGMNLL
ncbi:MAG: indolepyruvate oxidoreductase subunit beta [Clostridiales Family XIII bacterium]|jgi:indolepyruvate ferredoxin oxidoreductase beta subunit|nr:indolepyruvate oxidoreductase subunit beta [Clostridiales Family XIII bacterium]